MEHVVTARAEAAAADRQSAVGRASASRPAVEDRRPVGYAIATACCADGRAKHRENRTWLGVGGQMMRSVNEGAQSQRIVNRRSINTQTFSARFSRDRTLTLQGFSQAACRLGSNPLIDLNGKHIPICAGGHYVMCISQTDPASENGDLSSVLRGSSLLVGPGQCGTSATPAPPPTERGLLDFSLGCAMVMRH